jgi:hypothetical protein
VVGGRKTRPNPRSYRLSDRDLDRLRQLSEQEEASQAVILHRAIEEYARRHLKRERSAQ